MDLRLFLVRHAQPTNDSSLSNKGRFDALNLAHRIEKILDNTASRSVVIWTSDTIMARETTGIIRDHISLTRPTNFDIYHKLNDGTRDNFDWLKKQLELFEEKTLIVVSDLDYVRDFPTRLGFKANNSCFAQGVYINGNEYTDV